MSFVKKEEEYELDGHKVLHQLVWDKHYGEVWFTWIDGQGWPYRYPWFKGTQTKPSKARVRQVIQRYF